MKNYEEKYKEALEVIKKYKGTLIKLPDDMINEIFPELRESEDDRIRKELISFIIDRKNWFPKEETKSSWISWLEKQGEQKPAWSEEDEKNLKLLNEVITDSRLTATAANMLSNWLKSIKERVQPQPKQELSEEDEKMLDAMIDIVSNSLYEPLCPREEMLAWLKSIKPNNWKPSEFQLECLRRVIPHQDTEIDNELEYVLTELYDNLKKL